MLGCTAVRVMERLLYVLTLEDDIKLFHMKNSSSALNAIYHYCYFWLVTRADVIFTRCNSCYDPCIVVHFQAHNERYITGVLWMPRWTLHYVKTCRPPWPVQFRAVCVFSKKQWTCTRLYPHSVATHIYKEVANESTHCRWARAQRWVLLGSRIHTDFLHYNLERIAIRINQRLE